MSLFNAMRYDGKRVLVVGAASGMGAALAELALDAGATVIALDRAPIADGRFQTATVDLADRGSITAAAAAIEGPIDVVFSCAGVADGTPGIERINFLGHRLLLDLLVGSGTLGRGGAVGLIASAAGLGWDADDTLPEVLEYLAIEDFDEAAAWAVARGKADYRWSKQALCGYVASQAHALLKQGIRINAIMPGPTETPLAQANADTWLAFGADYRQDVGIAPATPLEQAYPLLFLCSDAASAVNGVTVITDSGYYSSGLTGSFPGASTIVQYLTGRLKP